jgi:hypothetical protein
LVLQFAHEVSNRDAAAKATKDGDMVGHAADPKDGTAEVIARATQVSVGLVPKHDVLQEWSAALRGENDVQVDLRKRLGHDVVSE